MSRFFWIVCPVATTTHAINTGTMLAAVLTVADIQGLLAFSVTTAIGGYVAYRVAKREQDRADATTLLGELERLRMELRNRAEQLDAADDLNERLDRELRALRGDDA